MWSKYIVNEWKYDKYGAQGKLFLLQEVLSEQGSSLQTGLDYQKAINQIFPRTFYCERSTKADPRLANTILKYFRKLELEFKEQELNEDIIESICIEETAEKFCIPVDTVREIANRY
jgi:hypothetical protein